MAAFRLDHPHTGRRVTLLCYTAEGYARVSTTASSTMPAFTFETPAARLFRITSLIS